MSSLLRIGYFFSIVFSFALSTIPSLAQIQPPSTVCGTDEYQARLIASDSTYRRFYRSMQNKSLKNSVDTTTIYTLPIVFVVYHLGEPVGTEGNLSDAVLQAALDTLNRNFAGQYPGEQFSVDTKIRFALAKQSPSCSPTSGIIRVNASNVPNYRYGVNLHDYTMQRQLDKLVPEYINFVHDQCIVVRIYRSVSGAGGWNSYSGIAIPVGVFNRNDQSTLTHEMGHALGLPHTFLGSNYQNGKYSCPANNDPGDSIDDTDPHQQDKPYPFLACPVGSGSQFDQTINPCTGRPYGLIGRNFMSYSCERLFTQGQLARMRAFIVANRLVNSPSLTQPQEAITILPACIPNSVSATSAHNDGVWSVKFGQIDKITYVDPYNTGLNYFDYTCLNRTNLYIGQTYLLEVLGQGRQRRAYIDYNNDGAFNENTEKVLAVDRGRFNTTPETTTISISIPTTAVTNQYLRMRVMVDGSDLAPFSCKLFGAPYGSGETEDYAVMILANLPCTEMKTVKDGNWHDPSVWSCSRVPTSSDRVQILHEVILPASELSQAKGVVYGPGGKLYLEVGARLLVEQ